MPNKPQICERDETARSLAEVATLAEQLPRIQSAGSVAFVRWYALFVLPVGKQPHDIQQRLQREFRA